MLHFRSTPSGVVHAVVPLRAYSDSSVEQGAYHSNIDRKISTNEYVSSTLSK